MQVRIIINLHLFFLWEMKATALTNKFCYRNCLILPADRISGELYALTENSDHCTLHITSKWYFSKELSAFGGLWFQSCVWLSWLVSQWSRLFLRIATLMSSPKYHVNFGSAMQRLAILQLKLGAIFDVINGSKTFIVKNDSGQAIDIIKSACKVLRFDSSHHLPLFHSTFFQWWPPLPEIQWSWHIKGNKTDKIAKLFKSNALRLITCILSYGRYLLRQVLDVGLGYNEDFWRYSLQVWLLGTHESFALLSVDSFKRPLRNVSHTYRYSDP